MFVFYPVVKIDDKLLFIDMLIILVKYNVKIIKNDSLYLCQQYTCA